MEEDIKNVLDYIGVSELVSCDVIDGGVLHCDVVYSNVNSHTVEQVDSMLSTVLVNYSIISTLENGRYKAICIES